MFNLGDGPFDGSPGGFAGSSNGTVIAINTSSGYLGRLCEFEVAGSSKFWVGSGGMCWVVNLTHSGSTLGFYNQPVVTRQSVTGSRGSQTVTVLTNLLTALNTVGIIQDSTTA